MLPRTLEVEVMDTPEEARDYDAMDHVAVNRAFVTDLLTHWNGEGEALDVGTGTAQIPLELCGRHPSVRVTAIDLAGHMLALAQTNVERAALESRVTLKLCDAKQIPFTDGSFQAVISNSIIHHIPEPGRVIAEMVRVAAPGALLFVRDLLRPADESTLDSLVHIYAGDANPHQRQMFRDSLHAALTLAEVRGLVEAVGYSAQSVQQSSDRHWTWIARR